MDTYTIQNKCNALLNHFGEKQKDFADKIGISKQAASALFTEGRGLTADRIKSICDIYKIDARFFFDQLDNIDDADIRKRGDHPEISNQELIARELRELKQQVAPAKKNDPLVDRVMANRPLRELIEMVQFWDGHMLRRFQDIAYGFVSGQKFQVEQKGATEKHGTA